METNFNFKSQVCTDKNQSERLLALGLKKETADCIHFHTKEKGWEILVLEEGDTAKYVEGFETPAWSLGRLIEMIQTVFLRVNLCGWWVHIERRVHNKEYVADVHNDLFDNIIDCIEWLIKEGYFNKEYLEE